MKPNMPNPLGNMKKFIFVYSSTSVHFKAPYYIIENTRYHQDWYEIRYYEEE